MPALAGRTVKRMLDGIRALPGVASASTTQNVFMPNFSYQTLIGIKDRPTPDGQPHTVQFRRISPDYFKTMRIQVLRGRAITDEDVSRPPAGCGCQQTLRRYAPGRHGSGRSDTLEKRAQPAGGHGCWRRRRRARRQHDDRPEPTLYLPWAQNNNSGVPIAFVIRTTVDPSSLVTAGT